jgi:pimeloyl-ACP methyl ester carboxylesterase
MSIIFQLLFILIAVAVTGCSQGDSSPEGHPPTTAVEKSEGISEPSIKQPFHFVAATTSQYATADGNLHVYLVQEPETNRAGAPVFIYMHGMGGKEEQGMEIFPSLRSHLNDLGWIYVCPRDNEYAGLLAELESRYGRRKIYLSGASAGGRWALWEAERHPGRYAGLILMCPAVRRSSLILDLSDDPLQMPVWIVCGEQDVVYAAASRWLTETLEKLARPVHYRQIPGGDHNDPCRQIRWAHALAFIEEHSAHSGSDIESKDVEHPHPAVRPKGRR